MDDLTNHERLDLVEPTAGMKDEFLAMAAEYMSCGNVMELSMYAPAIADFEGYLERLADHAAGRNLPAGVVRYRMYWLVRGCGAIVATSALRLESTPHVEQELGHIGYGVRPSQRRRGYGKVICRLTLAKARLLGMDRVLITCDSDNVASVRIIEANGGVMENQVVSGLTGKLKNRYWVWTGTIYGHQI